MTISVGTGAGRSGRRMDRRPGTNVEDGMRIEQATRPGRWRMVAAAAVIVTLAGCSSGSPTAAPTAAATAAASQAAVATAAPSATAAKTLQFAYISFAVANSYDAPMLAAAQTAAALGNAQLTVMDGNLDPATQTKQLQDATASGKYDGIITQPVYGAALVTGAQAAIAKGIAIGNIDQILGTDFTTADSQVQGQSSNVIFVASNLGKKIADLAITACTATGAATCKIGYIFSVKAAALDQELRKAFDAEIAGKNIQVVAEGESFYTPAAGLKATQDMLTAHPDINVIMGADQAITGALQAVTTAGVKGKVLLVGYGGGAIALQGIASGDRFGTVMQAPATEGRVGVTDLIQAIRTGTPVPGVDVLANLPDGGVVTKDNVQTFLPLAEWPG
jgi:ribose transport system substrate-binding protein